MSVTTDLPGEQRLVLHNVQWETYARLLADLACQSSPRLTYDEGTLELMTPLVEHERLKHAIEVIVECLAEEFEMNWECLGSTTYKREDLQRGFEPDSSFYIQNEPAVKGKKEIDLAVDPPPDLVIEIDISSGSIKKFPIFACMGISEVWRHDGSRVLIYRLIEGNYEQSSHSLVFPLLESTELSQIILQSADLPSMKFRKLLRDWASRMRQG